MRDWQRRIRAVLEADGDTSDADALDGLAEDVTAGRARVLVQRVHGDLHVGRVLRWTRGLSIVGFDAAPAEPHLTGATTLRPAAADVARLLGSLGRVAANAASRPDMPADVPYAWYRVAREQALEEGFGTLADYIFAESRPGPTIAMTAQGAMAMSAGGPLAAHGTPTLVG